LKGGKKGSFKSEGKERCRAFRKKKRKIQFLSQRGKTLSLSSKKKKEKEPSKKMEKGKVMAARIICLKRKRARRLS